MGKIPWITDQKATNFRIILPIDMKKVASFLNSSQLGGGFYKSLEDAFWIITGLEKLGEFPETINKSLISSIMKHRIESGGYSNKIEGDSADVWSTFYAVALLEKLGVFKERLGLERIFCPNCGQKQLFKSETCFNCGDSLFPEKTPCVICNKVVQLSPPENPIWDNLCNTCHEIFTEDIEFILKQLTKKGLSHCSDEKCIICKGKSSYKSTFLAINTLIILKSLDRLDRKLLAPFLKKNQYIQEIERIYQILSYNLLNEEDIDYTVLLEPIVSFQEAGGFELHKRLPGISDTFWCIVPFWLLDRLNMNQLGPILKFLVGLKRADGGYSEQIMDAMSNPISTVQALLIILMIFPPLIEQIEDAILRDCSALNRIYLDPISDKNLVSSDLVESVAYDLLSKEWFEGKILDQMDYFLSYLEESNIVTQKIGKSILKAAVKQSEINLTELSREFDFDNAEARVKTGIIDFLSKKFLEGEILKIKKNYVFQNVRVPRKFIFLEKNVPINTVFEEKNQVSSKRQYLESKYESLLDSLISIETEVQSLVEKGETDLAREKLKLQLNEFPKQLEEFENETQKILSEFKYVNFKEIIQSFLEEFPTNKKSLISYLNKLEEKLTKLIMDKEKSKAHDARVSKEQRMITNFEEYLQVFIDKVELLSQNFKSYFQQNYMDQEAAYQKILEIKESIKAFDKDISEKEAALTSSIELIEKPDQVNKSFNKIVTKMEILKEIENEATNILKLKTEIPQDLEEKIQDFKEALEKSRGEINNKIENKEFDSASQELENQDQGLTQFKVEIRQILEEKIKNTKDSLANFTISFEYLRELLNKKIEQLEIDWTTQKEELLTKKLEKTELAQKTNLKNMMRDFIESETKQFESLKQDIETKIRHENITEAKTQLELAIAKFDANVKEFEDKTNDFIKNTSKTFRSFKKNVNELFHDWTKEVEFIQDSINTLMDQITNLIIEKSLLKEKNKLSSIIKNQKLVLTKSITNVLTLYRDTLQKNSLLQQENKLYEGINNIRQIIKKADSQVQVFIKDTTKNISNFQEFIEDLVNLWRKESNILNNSLQKLQDNLAENLLIERIYFVIKAFQGYKAEIKYLAKSINLKFTILKDKLVHLISNGRLEGQLDPIDDLLILNSLKPVNETTETLLHDLEQKMGQILKFDFEKKEEMPKDLEDKKQYLLQLRYILIIHRQVGATLFHRKFGTWDINPDLISGFLTAIQSFGQEIKSKDVPIHKMAYKEFEILLNQGELVFVALIVDGKTTEWHEEKLAQFTEAFEQEFQKNLKMWSGELTQFKSTGLIIDRLFELFRVYT